MIRLTPSKSSLWSSRLPNDIKILKMEDEHLLYNFIFMKLDVYIPIYPYKSPTSCPWSAITQFLDFGLISLTTSNTWCGVTNLQIEQGWTQMQRWYQNCFDEALKVSNSVSPSSATIMQKMIWFSYVHINRKCWLTNWSSLLLLLKFVLEP